MRLSFAPFSGPYVTATLGYPHSFGSLVCESDATSAHHGANCPTLWRWTAENATQVVRLRRRVRTSVLPSRAPAFQSSRLREPCGRSPHEKCNSAEAQCASRRRPVTYPSVPGAPSTFHLFPLLFSLFLSLISETVTVH